ncbi:hypothetical protein FQR65_LT11063 [Abscondita terminalis]|nr:hypothetical protein FQR65_LT11063 [Abscondita terminalis]
MLKSERYLVVFNEVPILNKPCVEITKSELRRTVFGLENDLICSRQYETHNLGWEISFGVVERSGEVLHRYVFAIVGVTFIGNLLEEGDESVDDVLDEDMFESVFFEPLGQIHGDEFDVTNETHSDFVYVGEDSGLDDFHQFHSDFFDLVDELFEEFIGEDVFVVNVAFDFFQEVVEELDEFADVVDDDWADFFNIEGVVFEVFVDALDEHFDGVDDFLWRFVFVVVFVVLVVIV